MTAEAWYWLHGPMQQFVVWEGVLYETIPGPFPDCREAFHCRTL